MASIIPFDKDIALRRQYIFKVGMTRINNRKEDFNLLFPCLTLYEKDTGIPIAYPGFERWYLNLFDIGNEETVTMRNKGYAMQSFMNYILWYTSKNQINEVDYDDIRNWAVSYRTKADGSERTTDAWGKGLRTVFTFLTGF